MKLSRIYESDYFAAVRKVHEYSAYKNPFVTIAVRSVESYQHKIMKDFCENANDDVVTLNFFTRRPDIITGLRYWKLRTEIILVPDEF